MRFLSGVQPVFGLVHQGFNLVCNFIAQVAGAFKLAQSARGQLKMLDKHFLNTFGWHAKHQLRFGVLTQQEKQVRSSCGVCVWRGVYWSHWDLWK